MKKTTKQQPGTPKGPEPMDDSGVERKVGVAAVNNQRDCWAIQTLVEEFTSLFPETGWSTSNYDGRNTALDVSFDLTSIDETDRPAAAALLLAVQVDARVLAVEDEEDQILVAFRPNPRTQDLRTYFGLAEVWVALTEDGESW